MKIVICNKYFFLNGGTDRYLYDLMLQLGATGHTAIPFSVRYAGSWETPYSSYFLDPPGRPDQIQLKDIRLTPFNWFRFLDRSIYSLEARLALSRLLGSVQGADIAYILNIYNYMSPSILHTFRKRHIPVVMHLGDYNLLCPNYTLLRDGKPCTLCVDGAYHHGLRYCCVKKSIPASAVRVAAMYLYRLLNIYDSIRAFVVPCEFMKTKLVEGGFPEKKIHMLRYPVVHYGQRIQPEKKNAIVYFGRISYEKGLDLLIRAYQNVAPDVDLILIGKSYDHEIDRLKALILPAFKERIRFPGFQEGPDLYRYIAEALFTVVPSRWYDNAPLSIYESYMQETPVLAAAIGGIPEQVMDGVTGKLFAPDSEHDLTNALQWMIDNPKMLSEMGRAGHAYVVQNLSIKDHTKQLLALFETVSGRPPQ